MNTRRYRKIGFFRLTNTFVSVITIFFFSAFTVFALPGGQQVVNGQVTFSTQGNNMTITNSPNAIINWQGFSINSNEAVRFIQPCDTSAVLNRVIGQDPSQILGILQSNGRVFLVNPNGILVGKGAKIDTNGFFASTLDISNLDFMGGKYNFKAGLFAGSIENQGTITTPAGGKVYLIAPNVVNSGIINTPQGEVLLAASHSVHMIDSLDPNIAVVISAPENKSVNLGQIIAQSGKVGIYGGMIVQQGVVNADKAVVAENGRIFFKANKNVTLGKGSMTSAQGGDIRILGGQKDGTVKIAGTIDASAPKGGNGGFIETSAAKVKISEGAFITTIAPYGKTGTWFIDPTNFTIAASGGDMTGTDLSNSLSLNNVIILSGSGATEGNGDIFVNDNITWSANKLTLDAYRNIEINRELFGSGTAQLALYYGQGVTDGVINGIAARYSVNAPVNLPSGNNFSTKQGSDGTEKFFTVINDLASLQNIGSNPGGYYALGGSIDASETSIWNPNGSGGYFGFSPIGGGSSTAFTGTFDGLGHTITGLYINRPATKYVGLFGYTYGSSIIQNVGLIDASVTGQNYVGGLAGWNYSGSISSSYITGAVTGTGDYVGGLIGWNYEGNIGTTYSTCAVSGTGYVGGLLGYNHSGSVSNSYSTGVVTGTGDYAGGLIGWNYEGNIGTTYSTGAVSSTGYVGGLVGRNYSGSVSNSYSTGAVTGTGDYAGGLIGWNYEGNIATSYGTGSVSGKSYTGGLAGYNYSGSVSNSYSTGAVTGTGDYAGGLIGWNYEGDIANSYSTGSVRGRSMVGGLVGDNYSGNIKNSFWDITTSGQTTSAGGRGMTTADFMNKANFTSARAANGNVNPGWNFSNTWYMIDGNTRPFLRMEYSTNITNAHQLQLMALNLGASYTLANNIDMSELKQASGMWNTSTGFVPIGDSSTKFTGTFDGLGHTITGLYINRPATNYGGLFGYTQSSSVIQNVGLLNANITGQDYVGGLVGYNDFGTISNSYNTGIVTGMSNVGGIVGYNQGGSISNSYSTGAVKGMNNVGGLVGYNFFGRINNTYYDIENVLINGAHYVTIGGLYASQYQNWVDGGYAALDVANYGASLPYNSDGSYYTVTTTQGLKDVLAFLNMGYTFKLGNNIDLNGLPDWHLPVFNGTFDGAGYTLSNLTVNQPFNDIIGFIGRNDSGTLINVGLVNVSITGNDNVGGLVGYNFGGTISNSYSTGKVNGSSSVGGLIGYLSGAISNSYNTGTVNGTNNVGGLVGFNVGFAISNSYNTGTVTGSGIYIGGLVGRNGFHGKINDAYNTGAVIGTNDAGGLVGFNSGAISNSYNTGAVTGTSSIGGLVGYNTNRGTVTNSFWDKTTAGVSNGIGLSEDTSGPSNTGATGMTTADFMNKANFTSATAANGNVNPGWNFSNTWYMIDGNTRPFLRMEYSANITNAHQLQLMALNLGASYTLASNIDMSELKRASGMWNTSTGFVPIGDSSTAFNGSFDGLSHTITGLYINRPTTDNVGFLGYTGSSSVIQNVGLSDASVTGRNNVGSLVGENYGSITNSYSTGNINGIYNGVGGLVGKNDYGSISNSYSTGNVTGSNDIGGLVGYNFRGSIETSYSTGDVTGNFSVGGLVGYNSGSITNAYNTGGVNGSSYVGGLVGYNDGSSISNSYNMGNVIGLYDVGGLVGWNDGGSITNSYSTGNINGIYNGVGGLVGKNDYGSISNSFSAGDVSGAGGSVGGLVGYNYGSISNSFSTGDVSGTGDSVGGLVGYNYGSIDNAYSTGTVSGSYCAGGLVGLNEGGRISNSFSTGDVSGTGDSVGGLVGSNGGAISNSYSTGTVSGGSSVGGLVGWNYGSSISNSYSMGAVNGTNYVGGLVGTNFSGRISNSFSTGNVTGESYVGGLVGYNYGNRISNSFYDIDNVLINGTHYVTEDGLYHFQYRNWVNGGYAALNIANYDISLPYNSGRGYFSITTAQGLKDMLAFLDKGYTFRLGSNINLIGLPDWHLPFFSGTFDGAGYTLSNLTVNQPFNDNIGFIGHLISGTLTNIGLINASLAGFNHVGGLVGMNDVGIISNSYSTGAVNGAGDYVGGLVGMNNGAIRNSYSTGNVKGQNYIGGLVGLNGEYGIIGNSYNTGNVNGSFAVGGLVGMNSGGTINNSYSSGNITGQNNVGGLVGLNQYMNYYGIISNSYNTGNVTGEAYVGGLVGANYQGTISNTYNTGNVSGTGDYDVGGLVGWNFSGSISNSYSTGAVTGTGNYVGGLVGYNNDGTITNSFWDVTTSGQTASAGGTGMTTADFMNKANFTSATAANGSVNPGWDFDSTWYMIDGNTRPFLRSEYSTNITNAHQLQLMALNLGASYTLANNIDMSELKRASGMWNTSTGFVPIGNSSGSFTGTFDGLGNTINGLYINRPTTDYVGLFGYTGSSTVMQNIGLIDDDITGQNYVGGLLGINNGSIINAYGTGTVGGSSHIGGLVGWNDGTISNSYSTGNVTGTSYIGGLAGYNSGNISASYNMGTVTGLSYVGGLVGRNLYDGTISNSYSTGVVTGSGIYIGGLVGHNYTGTVSSSYSTGAVSGGSYIGGLVGYNENGTINNSYNTGMVNGTGYYIGGLVGSGRSVSNSYYDIDNVLINGAYYVTEGGLYASQYRDWVNNSYKALNIANYGTSLPYTSDARSGFYTVTTLQGLRDMLAFLDKGYTFKLGNDINLVGLPDWHLPVFNGTFDGSGYTLTNLTVYQPFNSYIGFIGRMNNGTITNLGLINASVTGRYAVGGLAGSNNYGTIHNSYSTGNVSGSDGVGGLVGHNDGTIRYSFSAGIVSGMYNVGGLVGSVSGGNISNSYSTGNVAGTDYVGGLVGNTYSGSINNSYSTGNVTGREYVGGLVGYNYYGTIYDSNNTGNVAGTDYVGGLVGYAYNSRISNSYSTGNVTGREYVGGLVGYSLDYNYYSTIINSFNTGNVSGNYDVGGLVGWNQGSSIVENAYNTGNVSGSYSVGGLVGWNSSGTINNSYNTGTVSGSGYVGGLVGENDNFGTISNTYSTGNVSGTNYAGGLVGINWGTVTNSFWNTSTAGVTNGIGVGTSAGATGLTTDQMMRSANFTGFDFTNTWRIYEGHTTPLLRVFLKPLTITADDVVKVYDGTSVGLTNVAYSDSAAAGSSNLFGIATPYGSVVKNNVGVYSPDIWSNQQGYDITIGTQTGTYGTLTVTPRPVTVASIADVNTPYGIPAAAGAVRLDNVIANDVVYATADIDNPVHNPGSNSLKANSYTQSTGALSGADAPNYSFGGYTTPNANYVVEPGQIVSGMLNLATAGKSIYFMVNGTLLADQGITDANGNYSAMFPLSSISSNSALLAYVANDSAVKSASVYAAAGGDISGLALYTNTLTASSINGTMSNTTLGTARGSVTSDDIPFTVSGNDLSLMNGISFVTASGTDYLINGAITTLNGSQTYNGTVTLSGNTTLTASGTGGITFGGPVTGADDNLNATAGGDITVGGPINVETGSVTLTASNGAIINGMGSARSITADSLFATAANGIGSGNPLTTGVHNLSAVNTVANNIQISNTGSLAVGDMRNEGTGDIVLQNIGRTTTGSSTVTSAGGNVSITVHSPLTIGAGGVSAYRNITLVASPGGVSDDLTINGPLTASTGNINLTAGSLMVFGPEGSMSAPQGKSMLKDGGLISAGNKMAGNSTVISISKVITNIIMADDDRASEDEDVDQNED